MKNIILIALFLISTYSSYAQNNNSIIGLWQLKSVELENGKTHTGMQAIFLFDENNVLKAARSVHDEIIVVGKWKIDKKNKALIMESSIDKDFNGKAEILFLDSNKLSYKKEGEVLNFEKTEMKEPDNTPVPELKFTQNDFYKGDEYAYPDDEDKLPWNFEQIYYNMKDVKEIVYNIDHFKPQKGKVDTWTNSYKVAFYDDENSKSLSIREYSNFRKDYIDMTENRYPLNDQTKQLKEFYPLTKPELFRVADSQKCKTSLGIFDCTVVEAIDNFDKKIKYWMINDKPGVFAKIIIVQDNDNPLDYANVYTLKNIK